MKKCLSCGKTFKENDELIRSDEDELFHEDCVDLVPCDYLIFPKWDWDGDPAKGHLIDKEVVFYMLNSGEYLEED